MNKKLIILVAVLIILIILISMGIFSFLNKPKIVEIKTFSELPGFTFDYPVFEKYEISSIEKVNETEYKILFHFPKEETFHKLREAESPTITIKKEKLEGIKRGTGNPKGIPYYLEKNTLTFYDNKEWVKIDFSYGVIFETSGFPKKILFNRIIDSFKFTSCSPESFGAVRLRELADLIKEGASSLSEPLISRGALKTIARLKENNENPDDFYATTETGEKSGLNGHLITFYLYHKDDFKPENCNTIGNPSGKDRVMVYDANQKIIISDLLTK